MIRSFFIVLVISIHFYSFSQKSEIIQRSSFKHNYAIGYCYYVEDNIDTSRLFFMGVVKVISSNKDEYVVPAITLLNSKTKELNGNSYKLRTYNSQDTTLTMLFDVYFASEKYIELMKTNAVKEKIVLFNNTKDSIIRTLIVNDILYNFPRDKHFEILTFNKDINLKLQNDSTLKGTTENIHKNKKAVFLTIKKKDTLTPVLVGGAIGGIVGAIIAKEIAEGYPRNNSNNEIFSQLNYNTGRILMNLYPLQQQIKVY